MERRGFVAVVDEIDMARNMQVLRSNTGLDVQTSISNAKKSGDRCRSSPYR